MRLQRWRLYIEGSCPVCQRALSATLFSDKALVKGLTPTGHGCWGGERASVALQPYSPAGRGYLSHQVHSSDRSIPSTTSTTTQGEGHIRPYLSVCTAALQHTQVEPGKTTFCGKCKEISKLESFEFVHCLTPSGENGTGFHKISAKIEHKIIARS